MRRLASLALAFALIAAPVARAGDFVAGTEDVPLMTGLAAVEGSLLMFDKPEGRFVESAASGAVKRADVIDFYGQTLPQLGWKHVGPGDAWRRDKELLRLTFKGADGALTVTFTLSPG